MRLPNYNNKIKEYIYTDLNSISGNAQRNYALTKVTNPDALLYYLDDDNLLHPNIYNLLNIIDNNKMYTFNQYNTLNGNKYNILNGNNIQVNSIDTAMCIIPYKLCKDEKWILNLYHADGYYIVNCYNKNKDVHIFVNNNLCYYNKLEINN